MGKGTYGRTASGVPITDELVAALATTAEAGYSVDEMLTRRGDCPPTDPAAASLASVRLEPQSPGGTPNEQRGITKPRRR
jgi:hypothetical protein